MTSQKNVCVGGYALPRFASKLMTDPMTTICHTGQIDVIVWRYHVIDVVAGFVWAEKIYEPVKNEVGQCVG